MLSLRLPAAWVLLWGLSLGTIARAEDAAALIEAIRTVGLRGAGHEAAAPAIRELSQQSSETLPAILEAMQGAELVAGNWLRGAFEAIAERTLAAGQPLPAAELEAFFTDRSHEPRVRRLAWEWLVRVDPAIVDRLPPQLDDPSSEMRRDAVARELTRGKQQLDGGDQAAALATLRGALVGAGDEDQVKELAELLDKNGEKVDLVQHAGFLMTWRVAGPFDNAELQGFAAEYAPEQQLDYASKYTTDYATKLLDDKEDTKHPPVAEFTWVESTSDNAEGLFDIAKVISAYKGAVAYAATEFDSSSEQPCEFRFGTPNAYKLWLNGDLLFAREEYHRGMFLDQYQVRGQLKPGKNVILLKLCQNEQKEPWAQDWVLQFRVCQLNGLPLRPAATKTAALRSR